MRLTLSLFFITICFTTSYSQSIESKIDSLLSKMSLDEKIGQLVLKGTSSRSNGLSEEIKQEVREGKIGAMLNLKDTALVLQVQKIAVNESPNHIPLLFGRDVIHGYKTIFPIPLGLTASWNPSLAEQSSKVAANEAYSRCINWTFAPMVDLCRDARWGRIAESPGEDPLLASLFASAYIKGFQGSNLNEPGNIIACTKHFAAYGAAEGGRDYNTVNMPEFILRNFYLKPFQASVEAGSGTFMTSFNDLNGIPASANEFLLKNVLRNEWLYDGFIVSDWNSVTEMIPHGFSADEKDAALSAIKAGLDMEMTSEAYVHELKNLLNENAITIEDIDDRVRNVLRIKFRVGSFENPYFKQKDNFKRYAPASLELAKQAAIKSCVLLKNDNAVLPLNQKSKIAVIGPLADAPREQLGTWTFDGDKDHSITPLTSLQKQYGKQVKYASGLVYSRSEETKGFEEALTIAKQSDVILFFGGEEAILSGEAHSRADIRLPGIQEQLIHELHKIGKPIVLILMAGRPITMEAILPELSGILMAWHPGTMAGPALTDLISGKVSPSGKLPLTWPKTVGQIPIYYNHTNTGRPADSSSYVGISDIPIGAWQSSLGNQSHYLDAGFNPLYPFGYGLTYSSFELSALKINQTSFNKTDQITATVTIQNTGKVTATETVQLYIRDKVGSVVRPVKELKGFEQIELKAGESKTISISIPISDLAFYNSKLEYDVEKGDFELWISTSSAGGLSTTFKVK